MREVMVGVDAIGTSAYQGRCLECPWMGRTYYVSDFGTSDTANEKAHGAAEGEAEAHRAGHEAERERAA